MQVYRHIESLPIERPVVAVGSFDGVHRGHQFVLQQLFHYGQEWNGTPLIVTFEFPPRLILGKEDFAILSTLSEKLGFMEKAAVKHVLLLSFLEHIQSMSYQQFLQKIIMDKLGACGLVVGYDQRLGNNREGNFTRLKEEADRLGLLIASLSDYPHACVSSSNIRGFLLQGDVENANHCLGYAYRWDGKVVTGEGIGRQIGFPTANLDPLCVEKLLPAQGVYAVYATVGNQRLKGMINIGVAPTVRLAATKSLVELHLFNFTKTIYGEHIQVEFVSRLRGEQHFASKKQLVEQLWRDKETSMQVLKG